MKWKPHPKYKDSGVEWMGHVPERWTPVRNKAIFREVDQRSATGDGELLTVSHITGVGRRSEKSVNMFMAETLEGYKTCRSGDLVINTMWAWMGALGISPVDGLVSPSYNVYRLRDPQSYDASYLDHLSRAPEYVLHLRAHSTGVWESRLRLYPDEFLSLRVCIPTIAEQQAISQFLNRETARIDELVAKQERLVELLQEKRQALISYTITKGLNPNVPMKPSGVECLGDVPAHWEKHRLGHLVEMVSGSTPDKAISEYWNGGVPWVSPKDMKVEVIRDSQDHVSEEAVRKWGLRLLPANAVLVVVRGMILAHSFPVARTSAAVTINQDMKALLPKASCSPEFLALLLRGLERQILSYVDDAAHGTKCIRTERWKSMQLFLPDTNEQLTILSHVAVLERQFAKLLAKVEQSIALMREHRAALISAAVTGKIDIREVPEVTHA